MSNIKEILKEEKGIPLFHEYLRKKGYSNQLLYKYVQGGWLNKLGPKVYALPGQELDPVLTLKAMQQQLGLKFYFGARSALNLYNKKFNITFSKQHFDSKFFDSAYFVFIPNGTKLPVWKKTFENFDFIKSKLFKENDISIEELEYDIERYAGVKLSSVERALIELADLIPKKISYEELINALELSPNLRSSELQRLLESCLSISAKRVFLAAADQVSQNWFKNLDIPRIDLGKGPRQIVKKGIYIKKYQITVPDIKNNNG